MPPIERVKLLGRRVEVWGFKESIGRDLKKEADKIEKFIIKYIIYM